jgi:23S rRNA (uracil1939-C5)-methyltransferase
VVEVLQKKDFSRAKVVRIEEKSKGRIIPECSNFNQCGGSQLQHISYESQEKITL